VTSFGCSSAIEPSGLISWSFVEADHIGLLWVCGGVFFHCMVNVLRRHKISLQIESLAIDSDDPLLKELEVNVLVTLEADDLFLEVPELLICLSKSCFMLLELTHQLLIFCLSHLFSFGFFGLHSFLSQQVDAPGSGFRADGVDIFQGGGKVAVHHDDVLPLLSANDVVGLQGLDVVAKSFIAEVEGELLIKKISENQIL
jgi:hypothetical protein